MSQSKADRIFALESLLPLVEGHIAYRATQQYGASEGPPPVRPKGWVPPLPEPDCQGHCDPCPDFGDDCTMRELFLFHEWERLRAAYPAIQQIEVLLGELMRTRASWGSALYWIYLQPWDNFERARREDYAKRGVEWLEERFEGYLPAYEPRQAGPGRPKTMTPGLLDQARELRAEGLSFRQIERALGPSKDTISRALKVRS